MTPEQRKRASVNSSAHYHRNREKILARHKIHMEPRFVWLKRYKESRPCTDCKNKFPAECMDFDHLPGTKKLLPVAHLLHYKDFSIVEEEIRKCELVCANCHRVRTFARKRAKIKI